MHEDQTLKEQFRAAVQAQPEYHKVVQGSMDADERMRMMAAVYHSAAAKVFGVVKRRKRIEPGFGDSKVKQAHKDLKKARKFAKKMKGTQGKVSERARSRIKVHRMNFLAAKAQGERDALHATMGAAPMQTGHPQRPQQCKQMFRMMKHLEGKREEHGGLGSLATMDYNGQKVVAEGENKVGELVSTYTAMVSRWDSQEIEFDDTFREEVQSGVAQLNSAWQGWGCEDKTLEEDDVRRALKYLQKKNKLHKAPGMDNVANWMLVWGGEGTVQMLTPLYKEVWNTASMPKELNKALVRYIYKGKGSKLELSNYRPISLLSVIAKLYTVILLLWVGELAGPQLVVEQGCAKPNQGHVEHLWASCLWLKTPWRVGMGKGRACMRSLRMRTRLMIKSGEMGSTSPYTRKGCGASYGLLCRLG